MCYKCSVCQNPVPAGQPQRRHVVKKPDGNVLREVAVCESCQAGLRSGYTLATLVRMVGKQVTADQLRDAVRDLAPPAAKVVPKSLAPMARPMFNKPATKQPQTQGA